jgi:hypothetical protein
MDRTNKDNNSRGVVGRMLVEDAVKGKGVRRFRRLRRVCLLPIWNLCNRRNLWIILLSAARFCFEFGKAHQLTRNQSNPKDTKLND